MTLYDLFHPLIVHMVTRRHEATKGAPCTQEVLYGYVAREYAAIRKTGLADKNIAQGVEDACTYTAFYIDFMVHEGPFPFASTWRDLGRSQYNELAGDEKFFDYMRRWLAEDTPLAKDHLRLMHAMVTSGFSGALERRSVRLEELMRQCADKLALPAQAESTADLFTQSPPSNASLHPRKPRNLAYLILALSALGLLYACIYYINVYTDATDNLRKVLNNTTENIKYHTLLDGRNSDTLVVSPIKIKEDAPERAQQPPATPQAKEPATPQANRHHE